MKTYGLIGFPLGHSFSEEYFRRKFEREAIAGCEYRAFPLEAIGGLPGLLREVPSLCGLNVTIPYKEAVLPYLDAIDPEAAAIGAVNCIRIENNKITGYNTDVYGFRLSLLELLGGERPEALVLGSGGASKAIRHVLRNEGIRYLTVSRDASRGDLAYSDLTSAVITAHHLIINATPLGTSPDADGRPPIPYEAIGASHMLFDVVYNPAVTRFLASGARRGARTMNGAAMLAAQAERSWEIWQNP